MGEYDYDKAVEIAPNVYWVGYNILGAWFRTNPYLIIEGDEAALIDPGSIIDFNKVFLKVKTCCIPKRLRYIILQHQDPDLCSSTVKFEKMGNISTYMPTRSAVFAKFYGIKSFTTTIDNDEQSLEFKTGRKLRFFLTPYCHSPGAMVTYDEKNKILFSSDIFGAFNNTWELFADMIGYDKHLESVKKFMQPYMASREAVMNFVKKIEKLDIKMICPQHGSIIRKDVKKWIGELKEMKYGTAINEVKTGLEL